MFRKYVNRVSLYAVSVIISLHIVPETSSNSKPVVIIGYSYVLLNRVLILIKLGATLKLFSDVVVSVASAKSINQRSEPWFAAEIACEIRVLAKRVLYKMLRNEAKRFMRQKSAHTHTTHKQSKDILANYSSARIFQDRNQNPVT